jgi:hypothetical protein
MGKFKDMVTTEMTTQNVTLETAVENLTARIRLEFTPEKNAARLVELQAKRRAEMMTTPRGRRFLQKQENVK